MNNQTTPHPGQEFWSALHSDHTNHSNQGVSWSLPWNLWKESQESELLLSMQLSMNLIVVSCQVLVDLDEWSYMQKCSYSKHNPRWSHSNLKKVEISWNQQDKKRLCRRLFFGFRKSLPWQPGRIILNDSEYFVWVAVLVAVKHFRKKYGKMISSCWERGWRSLLKSWKFLKSKHRKQWRAKWK